MDYTSLSWNVRGLNNPARRKVVADLVADHRCNLVCLQETKLEEITSSIVAETLGSRSLDNFAFLPAVGSRGGILLAANADQYSVTPQPNLAGSYSLSVLITDLNDNSSWMMTRVYGPQDDAAKLMFIAEMRNLKLLCPPEWVILGDFNLISRASEKSNHNVNLRMMCAFRSAIDDLGLKELPLLDRRFTWSNERINTTLTKIDKVLFSGEWETKFPDLQLLAGSTSISDHCPLILKKFSNCKFSGFRFEAWWPSVPGFADTVSKAWCKGFNCSDNIRRLHIKLTRAANALKVWSKEIVRDRRFQAVVAKEVIF